MSKTLSEIKDKYGQEEGFEDWTDFLTSRHDNAFAMESSINEISLRYFEANKGEYATACCKATQEKCAEKFMVLSSARIILDPSNIVLL